jgi:hypothetical protein
MQLCGLSESNRERSEKKEDTGTYEYNRRVVRNAHGNPEANHSKSLSPSASLLPDPDDGLKIAQANHSKFIADSMELILELI